jgi:O-antigen/teichoic acid export membrane protein
MPVRTRREPAALQPRTTRARSAERYRRAAITSVVAATNRGGALLASLITIPLVLDYLGAERFGVWMTLSSLIVLLSFSDLGVGNGVVTAVSSAAGQGDEAAIRRHVSSALSAMVAIAVLAVALFAVCSQLVDWAQLLNVGDAAAAGEVDVALWVLVMLLAVNIPLMLAGRVQAALQRGYHASAWQLLGTLLGFAAVIAAVHMRLGLPWLVGAALAGGVSAQAGNSVHFFTRAGRSLAPRLRSVTLASVLAVAKIGGLFFVLQVAVAIAFGSDYVIIARLLGPEAVTEYAVPAKLFAIVSGITAVVLQPLWPAYGEALGRGDSEWAVRTLARSVAAGALVAGVGAAFLTLGMDVILAHWVDRAVAPQRTLLLGLAAWTVLEAVGVAYAMFLNGAGVVRMQVLLATLLAIGAPLARIALISHYGVDGAPWGLVCAYLVTTALPLALLTPRLIASVRRKGRSVA